MPRPPRFISSVAFTFRRLGFAIKKAKPSPRELLFGMIIKENWVTKLSCLISWGLVTRPTLPLPPWFESTARWMPEFETETFPSRFSFSTSAAFLNLYSKENGCE
ncbi:hypothetical protein VIGAN_01144400 [Vigna angularis var. angularis]|uniref:Uncharacterized protein n=1 Tax=Vigna angularis var. angularis TaxID=157739 RepID=A0A0S3R009_PHAAN|nr:hypothetical protein VIGAN_01144400 [Vigna angularis var. angularis]